MAYNIKHRRCARLAATQALYALEFNNFKNANDISLKFLNFYNEEQSDLKMDVAYFKELYDGTVNNIVPIDSYIRKFCSRDFDRIDYVEKAVLRYSTYELLNTDLDAAIVINEAVKISQEIGAKGAFALVNSYLDKVKDEKLKSHNPINVDESENDILL